MPKNQSNLEETNLYKFYQEKEQEYARQTHSSLSTLLFRSHSNLTNIQKNILNTQVRLVRSKMKPLESKVVSSGMEWLISSITNINSKNRLKQEILDKDKK